MTAITKAVADAIAAGQTPVSILDEVARAIFRPEEICDACDHPLPHEHDRQGDPVPHRH